MALFVLAVIAFVVADFLLRYVLKRLKERKLREEREAALDASLRLDFSREAKTLRRAEVENPRARILCVDDEEVILDSFRKILVLDGYSVDTVQTGQEALGLIQTHHYDFVFTDLKMPEMSGEEVTKAVKYLRPDIDVIIITGYGTIESAVKCMQYGAMDYVQKPFSEDELLDLVKRSLIKRQENIKRQLKPTVHIAHVPSIEYLGSAEFSIPGGVFISEGHCWAGMEQDGTVKVGVDDFAKKLIGRIDDIELPNLGMIVKRGQPLFAVRQGHRAIPFNSPVSGRVARVNTALKERLSDLDITPYEKNWVCVLDADDLDSDIQELKIGKAAVSFYQSEIDLYREAMTAIKGDGRDEFDLQMPREMYSGEIENLNDKDWDTIINKFIKR